VTIGRILRIPTRRTSAVERVCDRAGVWARAEPASCSYACSCRCDLIGGQVDVLPSASAISVVTWSTPQHHLHGPSSLACVSLSWHRFLQHSCIAYSFIALSLSTLHSQASRLLMKSVNTFCCIKFCKRSASAICSSSNPRISTVGPNLASSSVSLGVVAATCGVNIKSLGRSVVRSVCQQSFRRRH
jgi:hypothetical protein